MKKLTLFLFALMMLPAASLFSGDAIARDSHRQAQAKTGAPVKKLDGWRSLKFGMSEKAAKAALKKEFKVSDKKMSDGENRAEKTRLLVAEVDHVAPGVGKATILLVFGYKSKSLIKIEVIWQQPMTEEDKVVALQDAAGQLRNYFLKQNYDPATVVVNRLVSEEYVLFFRARDVNGKLINLALSRAGGSKSAKELKEEKKELDGSAVLRLSYISNPEKPDVYKIDEGSF